MNKLPAFLTKNTSHILRKGFTLIELLIVIAILGILAAAVFAAIDPIDKINAGNDSKSQSDISQVVIAAQAYAVANNGVYPTALTVAAFGTELKSAPSAPTGYTYTYTSNSPYSEFTIYATLKSKKYTSTPYWAYCSSTGKAGAVTATSVCP